MSVERRDRLESLALRIAGVRPSSNHATAPLLQPGTEGARFSRATMTKVAIAGFASLALGSVRIPPALGASRGDCLQDCFQRHIDAAARAIRVCDDVFDDPKSVYNTTGGAWARWRALLKRGGWSVVGDTAKAAMWEACERAAIRRMENGMERCEDACRETCPDAGDRSPSNLSEPACRGMDPPPPRAPVVPPPPGIPPGIPPAASDECLNCMSVGGQCCPASQAPFFVCSNPDYPCS